MVSKTRLQAAAQVLKFIQDKVAKIHSKGGKKVAVRADILAEKLREKYSDEQLAEVQKALKGQRGKNVVSLTKEGQTDYPAPSAIVKEARRRNFMDTPSMSKKEIKKMGTYPYNKGGVKTEGTTRGPTDKEITSMLKAGKITKAEAEGLLKFNREMREQNQPLPRKKPKAPKRPEMLGGGMYKSKKHSYAAGGMVKDMKLIRSK